MASHLRRLSLLLLLLLLHCTAASTVTNTAGDLAPYCSHARYPALCVRTLAPLSPRTPTDVAVASVAASLSAVRSASANLRRLPGLPSPPPGPMRDCFQQLSDSADQLSKSKAELSSLRSETARMQLDNACTWVSAALTNEDTCLDGVKVMEPAAREAVSRKVREVERVTSNALYFVTKLQDSVARGKKKNP